MVTEGKKALAEAQKDFIKRVDKVQQTVNNIQQRMLSSLEMTSFQEKTILSQNLLNHLQMNIQVT